MEEFHVWVKRHSRTSLFGDTAFELLLGLLQPALYVIVTFAPTAELLLDTMELLYCPKEEQCLAKSEGMKNSYMRS